MKLRVIMLFAIAGAAACHRDPGTAPVLPAKPKVQAAAPNQPNPQQLTAGMVEAVAQGKPQGAANLKFDLLERPAPGQPLDVAIALLPQLAAQSATVAVVGSDGLTVDAGAAQFEFAAVEPTQVYRHSLKVTPAGEGFYFLTLSVSLQHDQLTEARVFIVPILVGGAVAAGASPQAGSRATPSGQPADAAHRGS